MTIKKIYDNISKCRHIYFAIDYEFFMLDKHHHLNYSTVWSNSIMIKKSDFKYQTYKKRLSKTSLKSEKRIISGNEWTALILCILLLKDLLHFFWNWVFPNLFYFYLTGISLITRAELPARTTLSPKDLVITACLSC